MEKLLTIVIPTYNMQNYLHRCLSSLLLPDKQLEQLEVLVVNDGSKDKSSSIAHEYETKFPNAFRVIDKENGNYGSCINRGLEIATGKYVKVLDADDSFDTNNFGDYLRFLCGVDADMIITPYTEVNEEGTERRRISYDLPENTLLSWKQLTPAFKKRSLQMHAVTYKLQNIKDIHYKQTEGVSYTDQEWIFTPLTTVNTAIAYPHTIYKYLLGREGQTVNPEIFKRSISQNELCCRKIVCDYKSFSSFSTHKQEFIDYKYIMTICSMYKWYLLDYPELDIMRLVQFDDFLKSIDSSCMKILDRQVVKHTHYCYIKSWHENRLRRSPVNRWYYWYSRFVSKLKRVL